MLYHAVPSLASHDCLWQECQIGQSMRQNLVRGRYLVKIVAKSHINRTCNGYDSATVRLSGRKILRILLHLTQEPNQFHPRYYLAR